MKSEPQNPEFRINPEIFLPCSQTITPRCCGRPVSLLHEALWSPAGKGLTSWLSFVVSNREFVTFPLVSWVRCGT